MELDTCLEHVGLAMDEIIDECEQAPFLDEIAADVEARGCHFCEQVARYKVSGE